MTQLMVKTSPANKCTVAAAAAADDDDDDDDNDDGKAHDDDYKGDDNDDDDEVTFNFLYSPFQQQFTNYHVNILQYLTQHVNNCVLT